MLYITVYSCESNDRLETMVIRNCFYKLPSHASSFGNAGRLIEIVGVI